MSAPEAGGWQPVAGGLPDSERTVLVYSPMSNEPVWMGWHDGLSWLYIAAAGEAAGADARVRAAMPAHIAEHLRRFGSGGRSDDEGGAP